MRLRQHNATQRLLYGIELLSKGSIVVTDRLDAHIFWFLLDYPTWFLTPWEGRSQLFMLRGRKTALTLN
jgi:exopolysaccharide biosynthesis predicted pyruvyltransferase EpsI